MRKYVLMLFLLCLYGLARGQTSDYTGFYWFDNQQGAPTILPDVQGSFDIDASSLSEGLHTFHYVVAKKDGGISLPSTNYFMKLSPSETSQKGYYWFDNETTPFEAAILNGMFEVDASSLAEGLHTFHYMAVKKDGGISLPSTNYFMKLSPSETSQKGFYWFDNETTAQEATILNGMFEVDASKLTEGLHTFHYMVAMNDGGISLPSTNYFMKLSPSETSQKGYYWFDNETTPQEAPTLNGLFEVDASMLSDGFHQFSYIAIQKNGGLAKPASCYFLKTAQIAENDSLTCICSVDGQLRHIEKLSQEGGIIHWNLDMQDLTDGIHQIQLQAVTKSGALSSSYSSYFMRVTTNEELNKMRCVYAIDNGSLHTNSNVVSSNGSYHFDLDLSELNDGLHYISVLLHNDRGTISKVQTRFFVKVPLGGNGITRYQYWLNDDDFSMAKTVTLPQKVNPLQLMSLLPVESRPLRSSQFYFDVSSGQPMIYAMNTIHLRFYDAAMRFSDVAKDYTDYSVGQEVNIIKTLESGVRETTTWPEENEIKWYQVTAERGDSLRFKLDHAATLQLFAPSGKEVYNVSGAESVSWGGLHAAEGGTFYVALHDVTATQGDDITIDYEHIDKYAVLRQDVSLVGNGGCSTITFEGNGFKDLYAVDLYNEQGDSIKHIYIGHESDATTSVVFDFTGATLGVYHAKFHFTEEDKVFTNLVTVEEARAIELATTVTYPSTFLRGTSTTYTVKITNKGNMTAYNVPLSIKISNSADNDISHVTLDGLGLKNLFDYIEDFDGWTQAEIEDIRKQCDAIGEDHYFIKVKSADDKGDSIFVRTGLFGLSVPPNSTKTITLTLTASENVEVWVATAKEVPSQTSNTYTTRMSNGLPRRTGWFCCHYEQINCILSIVVNVADIASLFPGAAPWPQVISCFGGAANTAITASALAFCNKENVEMSLLDRLSLAAAGIDVVGMLLSCAAKFNVGGKVLELFSNGFNLSLGPGSTAITCVSAFTQTKPDCPKEAGGGGGKSNSITSLDPNDIIGYTAQSGSHAIKDGLTDVYYRIEFENDPEFATAAAHEILVTDTLDATKFDLTTFTPTRVKIGEKSAELNGDKNFVTTIDMRPEINAIAQVKGSFDEQKGIVKWHITSLDPMTMEPTDDVMQGVLPVNYNGNGIGKLSYDISLKPGLAHGTEVKNRAGIVFDTNDVIMTPYWTNTIDRIAPISHVSNVKMLNDSTATVSIAATDELSGPWCYDVYVQYGSGAWFKAAENIPADTTASVRVYEGIDHGFYVIVTDSAGNVEQKNAEREFTLEVFAPQIETNTKIQLAEGWNWMSHNQNTALTAEAVKPKAQRIMSQTEELYKDSKFGWMGDLDELLPTQMYKVQMTEAGEVQLSGLLFNAAFRSIPLLAGWNWIGYPVANTMAVSEAMAKFEAEEGDALIGRDGLATFTDGQWTGTLTEMTPGRGYMYRSMSDKNLFLNATAQASSRKSNAQCTMHNAQLPEGWTVDKSRYPSVMGVMAELRQKGEIADVDEWLLAAFCGDECRGIAQTVNGVLMINVLGHSGEAITFRALHRESGEIVAISEQEPFRADLLGSMRQPYQLTMGELTGISEIEMLRKGGNENVYDMQGRKVDADHTAKGVYIVTDGKNSGNQKVVRK